MKDAQNQVLIYERLSTLEDILGFMLKTKEALW